MAENEAGFYSYNGNSFTVSDTNLVLIDIEFNGDGTKMLVSDLNESDFSTSVKEYSLSTAYDISTASATGNSITLSGIANYIRFNGDGTSLFILDNDNTQIVEKTLNTAYDITTVSSSSTVFTGFQGTNPYGFVFSETGDKMFIVDNDTLNINSYSLGTAYDPSTATFITSHAANISGLRDLVFNTEGTRIFTFVDGSKTGLTQHNLSTGFDLSTASATTNYIDVTSEMSFPQGGTAKPDDSKIFVSGGDTTLYEYEVTDVSITGTVYHHQQRETFEGAVVFYNMDSNTIDGVGLTDSLGDYTAVELPPGNTYNVSFERYDSDSGDPNAAARDTKIVQTDSDKTVDLVIEDYSAPSQNSVDIQLDAFESSEVSEQLPVADSKSVLTGKHLSDAVSATESITKSLSLISTESIQHDLTTSNFAAVSLSSAIELNSSYLRYGQFYRALTQGLTVSDDSSSLVSIPSDESLNVADTEAVKLNKAVEGSLNISDSFSKVGLVLGENVLAGENVLKQAELFRSAAVFVELVDEQSFTSRKTFNENVGLVDRVDSVAELFRALQEDFTISDSTVKQVGLVFNEDLVVNEAVSKDLFRSLAASVVLSDSSSKQLLRILSETVTVADENSKVFSKPLNEAVKLNFEVQLPKVVGLNESIVVDDVVRSFEPAQHVASQVEIESLHKAVANIEAVRKRVVELGKK